MKQQNHGVLFSLPSLKRQDNDPKYPTVVPVPDFDPEKDAARIETAIQTKGKAAGR